MKQIIVGIDNCQRCEQLKMMCPEAEHVTLQPAEILAFAKALNITTMPFVVSVGEPQELMTVIK